MAYPLRVRFRTGVTLAMFTLVVFTIVVGATTSRAFLRAVDDVDAFGGGFDVTAQVAPTSPLGDARRRRAARGPVHLHRRRQRDRAVGPDGAGRRPQARRVPAARLRRQLPQHDDVRPRRARPRATARRAPSGRRSRATPTSPWSTRWPRRGARTGASASPPELRLHGFYIEDATFDPVAVVVRDPRTGTTKTADGDRRARRHRPDRADRPLDLAPDRGDDLRLARRADRPAPAGRAGRRSRTRPRAGSSARSWRTAWRPTSVRSALHDALGASYTVNWLLLGFMGLGLIVGVAALGVVSARAVVERRQQIGVLRSIGFRRGMVQLSFLLESVLHRADRDRRRQRARPDRRLQRHRRRRRPAVVAGRAALRGAVGAPGDRLRGRLRRRAAHLLGPGRPRRARLPGGGAAVRVVHVMRAVVFEGVGRPLGWSSAPVPEPAGQLLLRVEACGICRTDLHLLDGEVIVARAAARPRPPDRRDRRRRAAGASACRGSAGRAASARTAARAARTSASARASPAATSTAGWPSTPSPTSASASRSRTAIRPPRRRRCCVRG